MLQTVIGPELPFLRRYARASTGSQALGDAAVREMLEAVLEDPSVFEETSHPRLTLYRLFHKLWPASAVGNLAVRGVTHQLSPTARQALLLTAVERFSVGETAAILGCDEQVVREQLAQAQDMIRTQLRADILVIEDEAIIALHIRTIVEEAGHRCVAVATTHREAVSKTEQHQPELILADISLADGSSGIDAVKDILEFSNVPVIFVTAFPERLLTGERPEPTYLITKPFEPEMLSATIVQALMFHREQQSSDEAQAA